MRGRHKKWAAPFLEGHPEIVINEWNAEDPFFLQKPLYLEIGAGKGDFVLQMSQKKAGRWLALERDTSIAGILAKKVVESAIPNIKVAPLDFDQALEYLKPLRFQAIFLNFSDPWPKKKHWKRRLTSKTRLLAMADLLEEGGEIRIKTDNSDLYDYTKEQATETPLTLLSDQSNYVYDPADDAMSEYERNFRSQNLPIHRLVYRKNKKE